MTTIKLGQLPGLPEKLKYNLKEPLLRDWYDHRTIYSFNQCKLLYDSLELSLDVEVLQQILFNKICPQKMRTNIELQREFVELEAFALVIAHALSDNISKILKICPAETERK